MTEKETELKYLINENEYISLKKYLCSLAEPAEKLQINYYYDTADFILYNTGETLRIRQIKDALKLEYKYGKEIKGNLRICSEDTEVIDSVPGSIKITGDKMPACGKSSGSGGVYYNIGSLVTRRNDFVLGGAKFSLDANYYLGILDYELEIEFEGNNELPDSTTKILAPLSFSPAGKYTRFINRLKYREDIREI